MFKVLGVQEVVIVEKLFPRHSTGTSIFGKHF